MEAIIHTVRLGGMETPLMETLHACLPPKPCQFPLGRWVAKEKIETLLLASEMPVSIPRSRTVEWAVCSEKEEVERSCCFNSTGA